MAGLPRVLFALVSLAGLANGILPGLLLPPGKGIGTPGGSPLLRSLIGGGGPGLGLGGAGRGGGLGAALGGLGARVPTVQFQAGPGGIGGQGIFPGFVHAAGGITPLVGGPGAAGNSILNNLFGGGLRGMPPAGGGSGIGVPVPSAAGGPSGSAPTANAGTGSAPTEGTHGATPTSSGSSGSANGADSSEEEENKKSSGTPSTGSRRSENSPSLRGAAGSTGSSNAGGSSEEKDTDREGPSGGGSKGRKNSPSGRGVGGSGRSRVNARSSEEKETNKNKDSNEDGTDSSENKQSEEPSKGRGRRRGSRRPTGGRKRREKRSFMDEFGLMGTKGEHHAFDNVPDHVKVVYCGRHEVPNPGGIEDHFCHPDATWDTLLRMRPDCICQQGFLRNSWGECISPAECDHCSDKHHLNMDYHLCESPCPIVCNQPIDENCPNTCFKECACRPGYIRAYPNGPCVSIKQCLPGCRGRNQIFSLCSSLCPPTCRKPVPKRCPNICAGEGCVCKPGYVVKKWEPLVCVRPENCPGRRKKCPGPNQRYSRCIRRCAPSCFRRRHRYCGHDCLGRGCVCKRGYVVLQRRPLVCVRRDECPARRKKCPARNQVYMYCKSKCPRTCEETKPRKCGSACGGEGCACKPGYVIKQEDPLVCVRRYQCDLEDMGHKGAKGAMGTKGSMGAKGAMGAKGSMESMGSMGAKGAKGAMGVKGAKSSSPYPAFPTWPSSQNVFSRAWRRDKPLYENSLREQ